MTLWFEDKIRSIYEDSPLKDGIYYCPDENNYTHFLCVKKNKVLDPYENFQLPYSEGYCQLFAYFLYINDTNEFDKVNFKKITLNNFIKYSNNTLQCSKKFINLVKDNKSIKQSCQKQFKKLDKKHYGIRMGTTFDIFLNDFETFDISAVQYYIMENFETYWKKFDGRRTKINVIVMNEIKEKFSFLKEKSFINNVLCVQPTEGECQFEAFQSIIAAILNTNHDSPYRCMLKGQDIVLIQY